MPKAATVDEYISGFPDDVKERLEKIRGLIRLLVPDAKESISYAIPGYTLKKTFIYFAGYKNHVSVYPAPLEAEEFKDKLAPYASGKGTVQFSNREPLPEDIISEIILHGAGLQDKK
jgi:uncharacterized protein YdhG (YjbR/CyaY superfamily)